MAKKVPKLFRREYSEKQYKRRLLTKTHTDKGRTLLGTHFEVAADNIYRPRREVTEEQRKELAVLAKEIKKNRSAMRKGRVILLLLVVGGTVGFNLLFKNMLLERAGERGLEEAFRARAEIDNLRFSLLQGSLTADGVRVADRQSPMENLFETKAIRFDMLTVELFKGNVVIEELSADYLQFGTPRERSGALRRFAEDAGRPAAGSSEAVDTGGGSQPADGAAGDAGTSTLLSGGVLDLPDPRSVVEEIVEGSESRAAIDELGDQAAEVRQAWETRFSRLSDEVESVSASIEAVLEIEPSAIESVEEAVSAGRRIGEARERVQSAAGAVDQARNAVVQDLEGLEDIDARIRQAIDADVQSLLDRLPGFEGGVGGLVTGLIQGYLEERLGTIYDYGERGLEIYQRLRSEEADPPSAGRRGTVVTFPTAGYPRFYLGTARASVGDPEGDTFGRGSVESISSDPQLVGEAPRLTYEERRDGRELAVEARLPAVLDEQLLAEIEVGLTGVDVALSGTLSQGVFEELSGKNDASLFMAFGRQRSGSGDISLVLRDTAFAGEPPEDPIRRALRQALEDSETVDFSGEFALREGRITALNGSSNLTDILSASVANLLAEQRTIYEARLREELLDAVQGQIEPLREEYSQVFRLAQEAQRLNDQTDTWEALLAESQREVERRGEALATDAADRLQDEAEERAGDVLDSIRRRF